MGMGKGRAMAAGAGALATVRSQGGLRGWILVGFWVAAAVILLVLTGVQFGTAATISILSITITKATPITLGALSGICSERTGVVNIGIEGMMLTAAFAGFMAGVYTHNVGVALLICPGSWGVNAGPAAHSSVQIPLA